jgi:glutathione S-transferase
VSQSERVIWLEELQIPHALSHARAKKSGPKPPELRALSPMGIGPVITDGALVLGESGAILEYLTPGTAIIGSR